MKEQHGIKPGRCVVIGDTKAIQVRIDPARAWVLHQLEVSRQMALGHTVERPASTVVDAQIVEETAVTGYLPGPEIIDADNPFEGQEPDDAQATEPPATTTTPVPS